MAIVRPLRRVGGIINSTDLNYNFNILKEDVSLAVEGLVYNDTYSSVEDIEARRLIPEEALVDGLWVAVSETGIVYRYNQLRGNVPKVDTPRFFGPNDGDLPSVPMLGGQPYLQAWYVCVSDKDNDYTFTSPMLGNVVLNDGDWVIWHEHAGVFQWFVVRKWEAIMDVVSILKQNLVGDPKDLKTIYKERLVGAMNELYDMAKWPLNNTGITLPMEAIVSGGTVLTIPEITAYWENAIGGDIATDLTGQTGIFTINPQTYDCATDLIPGTLRYVILMSNLGAVTIIPWNDQLYNQNLDELFLGEFTIDENQEIIPSFLFTMPSVAYVSYREAAYMSQDIVEGGGVETFNGLALNRKSIKGFREGVNHTNPNSYNILDVPFQSGISFLRINPHSSIFDTTLYQTVDNGQYIDSSGSLASIPNGWFSIQIHLLTPSKTSVLLYGDLIFATLADARAHIKNTYWRDENQFTGNVRSVEVDRLIVQQGVGVLDIYHWEDHKYRDAMGNTFKDAEFEIYDENDNTKRMQISLSELAASITRTLKPLDRDYTIADHADYLLLRDEHDQLKMDHDQLREEHDQLRIDTDTHIADKENPHEVTKTQVGLSEVTNDAQVRRDEMAQPNGVATLDNTGHVPYAQLPNSVMYFLGTFGSPQSTTGGDLPASATASGDFYIADMTFTSIVAGLDFLEGDWAIWDGTQWVKSLNSAQVVSVNGRRGAVVLDKTDVGLGNVDNTSDVNKPVSNATQAALNALELSVQTELDTKLEKTNIIAGTYITIDYNPVTNDVTINAQAAGHIIYDENGTAFPERRGLKFLETEIEDDDVNDMTVVRTSSGHRIYSNEELLAQKNNLVFDNYIDGQIANETRGTVVNLNPMVSAFKYTGTVYFYDDSNE